MGFAVFGPDEIYVWDQPTGERAFDALRKLTAIARGDWSDPAHQPEGDPPGSCDWGYCDDPATHWRWAEELGGWLPVCGEHVGPAVPAAAIDADLDERYEDHAR